MRRWLFAGVALAGFGAALGLGALGVYRAPGPLAGSTDVVVPRGGFGAISRTLQDAGVVESARALDVGEALTFWQGRVRAAEFSFPAGASLEQVLLILRHGRPVQHLLTVPEGVVASRVAQILAAAPGLAGDIVLPAEGGFLPESYAYERGASTESVVQRAAVAMAREVDRAWETRSADMTLPTKRDLVILASLVERETHLGVERPLVAAVFLNRLRLGMRLQSDPTVVYAVSGGGSELSHGLRRDELAMGSPYNTYVLAGLPAGPICNPGMASIEAAAHPARSDALYFVADGTGGHAFARSLEEHVKNVARFRQMGR